MKFNVNNNVRIKLTERGLEILKQQHDAIQAQFKEFHRTEWTAPKVDADGYTTMQMHDVMYTFGQNLLMGIARLPFETEMIIDCPADKMQAEIDRHAAGHRRYEILRKLNVVQFQALYTKSLQSPIPFDELVDMMGEQP